MRGKLVFRYGTVNCGKTVQLLALIHSFETRGRKVELVVPEIANRDGHGFTRSRVGIQRKADLIVKDDSTPTIQPETEVVIVDEAQFLSPELVGAFRVVAESKLVLCYGLRTDAAGHLFPGARRLFEICDSIEEIKTPCVFCDRKAIFSAMFVDGKRKVIQPGESTTNIMGDFRPVCWHHWTT